VVAGFSFNAKAWGVAMVAGLREVAFNEDAFRRLVMPPERKRLIEALVLSHRSGGEGDGGGGGGGPKVDVIAGKGDGAIFLLYGPPGVGKTLTAEAIAELLHKPLYVVSMGELGTSPEALEERLLDILDLCVPWGALVLIDEAEMLLERRSKNDIVRNAMVCVMLRLLEYHTGILFLTTNRVEALDPAFQSRVQCALRYDALDAAARARVWADLLAHATGGAPVAAAAGGAAAAAGGGPALAGDVDVAALAAHPLNGRQIKNALQLALALSRSEGCPLAQRHLDATVQLTTAFVEEGAAADH
jgi:SpoVK/Ycf46/Vps4 family AAA+-type ATPase